MLTFLFCLDENYNKQAITSINSLLNNVSEPINIFIIHQNPETIFDITSIFKKHKNLNNLKIVKYTHKYKFPNLENSHVSEATYYRIFIEDFIPDDIDEIIYLDADTVCLNNPIKVLEDSIQLLKKSNYIIGCITEVKSSEDPKKFNNLKMVSDNYFNAGVMIIDFKKWTKNNIQLGLLKKMSEIYREVEFWDQDVMNSYFDGKYLEINNNLNFRINLGENTQKKLKLNVKNIYFLHYYGSNKPWNIEVANFHNASFYQQNYKNVFGNFMHIESRWITGDIKKLISKLFSKESIDINFVNYFLSTLKAILQKK